VDIQHWQHFVLWCALLNAGALSLFFCVYRFAGTWLYGLHRRWFELPRTAYDAAWYTWLGAYKLAIWFFLLVPALALQCLR